MESKEKLYYIPTEWSVWDKVMVKASSLEEAIAKIRDQIQNGEIGLGKDPEYIDDTFRIAGDDGQDIDELQDTLLEEWNLSGGLDGEPVEEPMNPLTLKSPEQTLNEIRKEVKDSVYELLKKTVSNEHLRNILEKEDSNGVSFWDSVVDDVMECSGAECVNRRYRVKK